MRNAPGCIWPQSRRNARNRCWTARRWRATFFYQAAAEPAVNIAEVERFEVQRRVQEVELARAEAILPLRTILSPIDARLMPD